MLVIQLFDIMGKVTIYILDELDDEMDSTLIYVNKAIASNLLV